MTAPVVTALRRGLHGIRWYLRALTGESAYDEFVAHARRTHPGCPVPSRREFERERMADRDRRPSARCC
jgi:uncharacterized short protein YbdD (DUF466 family)